MTLPKPTKAEARMIGSRVAIVVVCVGCYFGTMLSLATYPDLSQPEAWSALQWLIGFLGTTVLSLTARGSDAAASPFMPTKTTDDELGAPL